jgi:hypothetical protein
MDELRRLSAAHYDPLPTSLRTGDGMAGTGTGSGLRPRPNVEEEEEKEMTEDQGRGANSSQGRGRAAYMYTPADRTGSSLNSESAYVTPSARTLAQSKRAKERSGAQTGGALAAPHSAPDNSPGSVPVPVAYTHTTSYPTSHNTYPSQSKSRSWSPLPSTDSTLYHAPLSSSSSFSSLLPAPTSTSFSTLGAGKSPDMLEGNVTSPPLPYPYSSSIGHSSGGMNREVLSSWEKAWGNSDEVRDLQGQKEKESYGDTGRGYFLDRIGSFDMAGDVESTGFIVNRGSRSSSPVVAAALGMIRAATGERREAKEEEKEEQEEGLALEGESDSSGSRAWDLARNRGQGPHSAGSGIGRGIGSGRGDRVRALLMRREAARLSDSSEEEEGMDHDLADTAVQRRGRERGSAGHTRSSATDAAESVGKGKGASYHIPTSRRDEEGQDSTPVGWQVPPHASDPFLETPNTILTRMRARLMQGDGEGEGRTSPYPPSPPSPSGALNSSNPQTGKKSPESTSSSSSVSISISSRSGSRACTGTGIGGRKTVRSEVDVRSADRGRGLGEEEKTYRVDSRNFDSRTASALGDEEVLKRALGVDSDEEEGDCTEEDSAASDERYQRARATLFNLMHSKPSTGK